MTWKKLNENKKKYLMKNIVNSIFILLIALTSYGQYKTKKYTKSNKKALVYQYDKSDIYSRGIAYKDGRLFIGNADGSLYYYTMSTGKSKLIFSQPGFSEMRDIAIVDNKVLGIQSSESGKLLQLDLNGTIKINESFLWKGVFLDGMDFCGKIGFMMGDPKDSTFSLFHTNDGGNLWFPVFGKVHAKKNEVGFASSGTNVQVLNDSTYIFVSGGQISRFFKSTDNGMTWKDVVLPYYPGESTGAYSVHFSTDSIGVIVGGDYQDPDIRLNICFFTTDGGETWYNSEHTVRGYRSCVVEVNGIFYACGRNGIDFSKNGGKDWIPFADGAYFSMTTTEDKLIATMKGGSLKFFDLIEKK